MVDDNPLRSEESSKLPDGYHEALVTAITVVIAVTSTFFLFWTIESESGCWTGLSIATAVVLVAGAALLFLALHRALSLSDSRPAHYEVTVRKFFAGIGVVALAVMLAVAAMTFPSRQQPPECRDSQQQATWQAQGRDMSRVM